MTPSHRTAAALIAIYGLIALIGGTIGFVKAGSVASLAAGGGSGLVLLIAAALVVKKPESRVGLIIALVVSVLLIGRFASTLGRGASPVAIVMIVGGVVALLAAAMALRAPRPHG